MIEKNYQPADIESRMSRIWEDSGAFKAGRPERRDAKPFTIVIPPPNVTGSLHMGHALNNTLQDILCRFERMRGRDVLWQPGTDHAGIATQMVVERQLMERQEPGRRDIGREKFLERVWQWKAESGGVIVNQLKRLGASCDWSRERFTMDEGLSRAVVKVFVQLYNEKLIYKDKRLVNWDPKLLTATSAIRWSRMPRNIFASRRRGPRLCSATARWRCIPTTSATSIWSANWRAYRSPSVSFRSSPTNTRIRKKARARSRSPQRTTSTISKSGRGIAMKIIS